MRKFRKCSVFLCNRKHFAKKQTYQKTGKVFLLSAPTIEKYMKLWGLEHKPKGHRGKSKCIRAIMALGDVSQMTAMQVAKAIDFSRAHVTVCLQKEGILYRRGRCFDGNIER